MRIFITGASGFVGSHTAKYLSEKGNKELILVDNRTPTHSFGQEFIRLDLSDTGSISKLISDFKPEIVMHYASLVNPLYIEKNPLDAYLINVNYTINLIYACIKNGVNNFIFPSSSAVYGNNENKYIDEIDFLNPLNIYSKTKEICERVLADVSSRYKDFRYVVLRIFRVVGTYPELTTTEDNNFINPVRLIARVAAGKIKYFTINGNDHNTLDGTVERDFIHIEDVMDMQYASLEYLQSGNESNTFNCGTGKATSLMQIVNTMSEISGSNIEVRYSSSRENEYVRQVANISKAQQLLGWSPNITPLLNICKSVYDTEIGL